MFFVADTNLLALGQIRDSMSLSVSYYVKQLQEDVIVQSLTRLWHDPVNFAHIGSFRSLTFKPTASVH
jgi:hypothetical protein